MPRRRRATGTRNIRRALASIAQSLSELVQRLAQERGGAASRVGRKLTLSPERRRALKLQGQYMTAVRALKPQKKAQVKAVRESQGFPAALALARRLQAP